MEWMIWSDGNLFLISDRLKWYIYWIVIMLKYKKKDNTSPCNEQHAHYQLNKSSINAKGTSLHLDL